MARTHTRKFLRNSGDDDRLLDAGGPEQERGPQEGRHRVAGPVRRVVPLVPFVQQADGRLEVGVQLEGRVVVHQLPAHLRDVAYVSVDGY